MKEFWQYKFFHSFLLLKRKDSCSDPEFQQHNQIDYKLCMAELYLDVKAYLVSKLNVIQKQKNVDGS